MDVFETGCDLYDQYGARITAEMYHQAIPGVRWFTINGQPVSQEEFDAKLEAAPRTLTAVSRSTTDRGRSASQHSD